MEVNTATVTEASRPGDVLSAEGDKMPEVPGMAKEMLRSTNAVSQILLPLNSILHLCGNTRGDFLEALSTTEPIRLLFWLVPLVKPGRPLQRCRRRGWQIHHRRGKYRSLLKKGASG